MHPERKEIARYLLTRGLDPIDLATDADRLALGVAAAAPIDFPDGLAPVPHPLSPAPGPDDPLPRADVVVITWTVGYHTPYGQWTSTLGALATWGIVAGPAG